MAHAILMPKPGQSTEECTVVAWHKKEGDQVRRGDVLFEIETDKSNMDVEAFDDGVLLKIIAGEGATVPVNTVCAYVGTPGEAIPEALPTPPVVAPAPTAEPTLAATPGLASTSASLGTTTTGPAIATPGGRLAISPRASRLAAEGGIDPRTILGTGPDGRIVERDVQAAIAAAAAVAGGAGAALGQGVPASPPTERPGPVDDEEAPRPLSRMRRVIADRLTRSWTTTPHFTVTVAVDVSGLLALRAELLEAGTKLTITDFVLAATARTLVEFPDVNSWTDGVSVFPRRRVQLGVAVALPGGLVVPVIRDANRLTVGEIHDQAATLAAAAREGSASVDDLSGSTFTVSNLGMLGVEEFSAIINPGEAAILAVSSAIPTPVAVGSGVEIRSIMKLTLSADHRIVDGAMGARFLNALQGRLEDAASFRPAGPTAQPSPAGRTEATARVDSPDSFDLVVLGAGTGGYTAAFRAAQLGLKVALIDDDKIGGTCLHRGCIPAKTILESADLAHRVREHGLEMGIGVSEVKIDYPAVARRKDQVVRRLWTGLTGLVGKNGVEWVAGRGRLDGPGRLRVRLHGADGTPGAGAERLLTATDIILATGSRVKSLPGIVPDGQRILTSDEVLRLTELPASIVIVGAGAVGAEFASAFQDLGVAVTLLEYLPAIVPLEDRDVSRDLERSFRKRGMTVITAARFDAASLVVADDGIRLTVGPEGGATTQVAAECILVATGRAANIEDLGLETTRVGIARGVIEVDGYLRTAEPHVYAIGDIVGGLWLAHTAAHEGLTAVQTIVGDPEVHPMDYVQQPRATYTRPEIGSIGLTEQACAQRGLPTRVGNVPFQAIAKAVIVGDREGFAKVIAHAETGVLLGIHIIGPHATDLIAEGSLAVSLEAAVKQIGTTTHPHPTLSEVLGEAAMAVDGRSINF